MGKEEEAVRNRMVSEVAGWFRGAPSSFQSGRSSSSAMVSMTAPDMMCAPVKHRQSTGYPTTSLGEMTR